MMHFETDAEIDALVARDRLLAELPGIAELELAQSLWRAAKRYNLKAREERLMAGDYGHQPLPTLALGLGNACELDVMG